MYIQTNFKRIIKYKPKKKRTVERPKEWWVDCLDEDRKANGLSLHGKSEGRYTSITLEEIARDQE